ncbi:MAG: hypothetical protein ABFS37_08500 [Acidobacteriota bacterium]
MVKGLVCASCAGTLEVEEGLTTVVCRYCGTGQAVVGRRGTRRMMVLDRLSGDGAAQAVMNWFRKGVRKEPALKREVQLEESFLAWFPFIRARCDVIGWVLGVDERRVKRGKRWVTVRDPVETQVSQAVDRTLAGADMSEFGVTKINLANDEILPLDEEKLRARGMVFRPNRAEEETASIVFHQELETIKKSTQPDKTSFSWYAVMRQKTDLVFYPLWVFRYSFRQRTYQVLVDAEDGTIAYGKAPGNHLWRAFSLVGSCGVACFLGTTLLQHFGGLIRSTNGLAALGVTGLLLAGFISWGFRQFRSGGVVEEGSGLDPDPQSSPLDTLKSITDEFV